MKTFTIENETNNITAHPTVREAKSVAGAERFATTAALAGLAADWPPARLIEIWNSLPGATPVKKFKDRATAVSRIWKAIQNLGEVAPAEATATTPVAPQTPRAAAAEPSAQTSASCAKKPPAAATRLGPHKGSKTRTILGLLNRPGGASLQQIMQATGWQAHSVRGFISGTARRKMGLTIVSAKTGDGERSYSIEA
jgi:hypothetical protein